MSTRAERLLLLLDNPRPWASRRAQEERRPARQEQRLIARQQAHRQPTALPFSRQNLRASLTAQLRPSAKAPRTRAVTSGRREKSRTTYLRGAGVRLEEPCRRRLHREVRRGGVAARPLTATGTSGSIVASRQVGGMIRTGMSGEACRPGAAPGRGVRVRRGASGAGGHGVGAGVVRRSR